MLKNFARATKELCYKKASLFIGKMPSRVLLRDRQETEGNNQKIEQAVTSIALSYGLISGAEKLALAWNVHPAISLLSAGVLALPLLYGNRYLTARYLTPLRTLFRAARQENVSAAQAAREALHIGCLSNGYDVPLENMLTAVRYQLRQPPALKEENGLTFVGQISPSFRRACLAAKKELPTFVEAFLRLRTH